jgi:hypothetical protein
MTTRASAGFDVLAITGRLASTAGGAAPAELHVFSYLACLLSLYEGRAPELWSYGFAATPAGTPYAVSLAEECNRLRAAGHLIDQGEVLALSADGARELRELRTLRLLSDRDRYLVASCAASTLLPLPAVADALSFEPQLQRALRSSSTRELFKPAGLVLLQRHFGALSDCLRQRSPDTADLLVATTVWLTYLAVVGRSLEPPSLGH